MAARHIRRAHGGRIALRRRAPLALALAAAVGIVAVGGALLGLRLAGPTNYDTRLGEASVSVSAAWHGEVDAFIPVADWGIRARPFRAPLRLEVEPRNLDRQAVISAASGREGVLEATRADAEDAAERALRRALLWAVVGALALGAVAMLVARQVASPGRTVTLVLLLAPAALAGLGGGLVLARVDASFDPSAFERASYYARGAELAQLLEVAGKAQVEGQYRSSVERTLSSYAALLNAGAGLSRVTRSEPAVLLSDLHANTFVIEPFDRLFTGLPIFFAGDLGQAGTRAEARLLVPPLSSLGRPLVAVSGNHDSALLMRALARAGVTVLTDRGRLRRDGSSDGRPVQRIGGLDVAGQQDPLEWAGPDPGNPDRIFAFDERPDGERERHEAAEEIVRWFEALEPRPDVVMLHQNGLAQALAREIEPSALEPRVVVLTGHDHEQHVDLYEGAIVVDAGTAGAGGLFGVGTSSVGVASLYFEQGGTSLEAVDLVNVEPFSGAAQGDRVIPASPEACDLERVRCREEEDTGGP